MKTILSFSQFINESHYADGSEQSIRVHEKTWEIIEFCPAVDGPVTFRMETSDDGEGHDEIIEVLPVPDQGLSPEQEDDIDDWLADEEYGLAKKLVRLNLEAGWELRISDDIYDPTEHFRIIGKKPPREY